MGRAWWSGFLVLACLVDPLAWAQAPEEEAVPVISGTTALAELTESIENWDEFSAANGYVWNDSVPTCLWKGITCSDIGQLQAVSLQCSGCRVKAVGTLPVSLSYVSSLQTLNLQANLFSSTLPPEWGYSGAFPALVNLYLHDNNLTGPLPGRWGEAGAFPLLQVMRVDGNALTGTLPAWGSESFAHLLVLRIFSNQLVGTLPASWGELPNVQILSMQENGLTGSLPPMWGFGELQALYLQSNSLTGSLPDEWAMDGAFAGLQTLELDGNDLGGTLPAAWGEVGAFTMLRTLSVSDTGLSGTLPPEWGNGFSSLSTLAIERNNIEGTFPASWANLSSLQRVVVRPGNSNLCGQLPAGSTFSICDKTGSTCTNGDAWLAGANCSTVAPSSPAAPASSGSSFPVAAVAAPVAAVVALILAGVAVFLVRRRRRRRTEQAVKLASEAEASAAANSGTLGTGGHPFDTELGQAAFTSPFVRGDPALASRTTTSSVSSYLADARVEGRGASAFGSEGRLANSESPMQADGGLVGAKSSSLSADTLGTTLPSLNSALGSKVMDWQGQLSNSDSSKNLDSGILFNDWEIFPSEVEIAKRPDGTLWQLGSGGFGTVYKALRNGVQPVAVKMLTVGGSDVRQSAVEDFRKEISILKACRDLNIVQFVGASLGPDKTMLVTEYCEGGNLCNNIAAGRVTWYRRGRKIALDVAKALVFLHSRRIVHFDLKSPNILLGRDGTAKISDVGMAKILNRDYITGAVGTLAWAAPEMLWGERCSEKADIYSYGIVLWEMCTGEKPVRGQLRDVVVPSECPQSVRDLILECLETRPSRRPSALQIVERLVAGGGQPPMPSTGPVAGPTGGTQPPLSRDASGSGGGEPSAAPPRAWLAQEGSRELHSAGDAQFAGGATSSAHNTTRSV